jgi:hypothetical protein
MMAEGQKRGEHAAHCHQSWQCAEGVFLWFGEYAHNPLKRNGKPCVGALGMSIASSLADRGSKRGRKVRRAS